MKKCSSCEYLSFDRNFEEQPIQLEGELVEMFYLCKDEKACFERLIKSLRESPEAMLDFIAERIQQDSEEVLRELVEVRFDEVVEDIRKEWEETQDA